MEVPFFAAESMNAPLLSEYHQAFDCFIKSGRYMMGHELQTFEAAFAKYLGVKHVIGISNGLDALHIALRIAGIKPGDEVLVPSNTYIATVLAVSFCGAIPVFVEPDSTTYNLDPQQLTHHLTPKTKGILPVHLYGQACEMTAIMTFAKQHNLIVVEDVAQGHGTTHSGQMAGSFGDINAFSFYPTKNLGAFGDAGALATNNDNFAQLARLYRNYGSEKRYYNSIIGFNARLDELQAALLNIKLPHLDAWNADRIRAAGLYQSGLAGLEQITLPTTAPNCSHIYHLFVILAEQRDNLMAYLSSQNVHTLIHYPVPPHLQQAYARLGKKVGDYPIAERLANQCLSLPIYPGISAEAIEYVCQKIRDFYRR